MGTEDDVNNVNKWSINQLAFMEWLALPKAERMPRTQKSFAALIDVSEKTLCEWKRLTGFADAVRTRAKEFMKDDVPNVLATIRKKAIAGSVPHINMFLAMTGMDADVEKAGRGPSGDEHGARDRLLALLDRHVAATQSERPQSDLGATQPE